MQGVALTRAGTIGPLADFVEKSGGSVARLFRTVELPLEIIEQPDRLILLRDQFRLVEEAAREIGDESLPARLSSAAGADGLGAYGRHVLSFERLGGAVSTAYRAYGDLLQASTRMELTVAGGWARWSYFITAPLTIGRQKNELLALGYMLDILRRFMGPRWTPDHIELPGPLRARSRIESVFRGALTGGERAAVIFPAALLDQPNPHCRPDEAPVPARVPGATELAEIVRHLIGLARLTGTCDIDGIAGRLGVTGRTLQRRLAQDGTSFAALRQDLLYAEARLLLRDDRVSITEIAYRLGYSDVAHFTRAFRRWAGEAPDRWRNTPRLA